MKTQGISSQTYDYNVCLESSSCDTKCTKTNPDVSGILPEWGIMQLWDGYGLVVVCQDFLVASVHLQPPGDVEHDPEHHYCRHDSAIYQDSTEISNNAKLDYKYNL